MIYRLVFDVGFVLSMCYVLLGVWFYSYVGRCVFRLFCVRLFLVYVRIVLNMCWLFVISVKNSLYVCFFDIVCELVELMLIMWLLVEMKLCLNVF